MFVDIVMRAFSMNLKRAPWIGAWPYVEDAVTVVYSVTVAGHEVAEALVVAGEDEVVVETVLLNVVLLLVLLLDVDDAA